MGHTPCVKPIRGKEHWEKHDDHWVCLQGDPEPIYFNFPGRMTRGGDLRSVCADHFVRINHEKWNGYANHCENEEGNL